LPKLRIAVTLERSVLSEVDALVEAREYSNRSQAVEAAVNEMLARRFRTRLAAECANLDRADERALAEEGMSGAAASWPEY
jgi:Arc/MetJ-type ribon-helix-helix transcriptional regulator